ncbi:MAG: hypothetical protein COA78_16690 [Blastopirellula sp.]|nr:MAG: hypothetical protein COA78_16690 [Blastopirellula sp.]
MKRIRSTYKQSILHNTWSDTQKEVSASEIEIDLDDTGGIQEHETEHLIPLDCSHFSEAYSLCGLCEMVLCQDCSTACATCGKPIGKSCHAVQFENQWFCTPCRSAQKRWSLFRLLSSVFIRYEGGA